MFFDDPLAAFSNLARWLAPGGRPAFAAWGPPGRKSLDDDRTPGGGRNHRLAVRPQLFRHNNTDQPQSQPRMVRLLSPGCTAPFFCASLEATGVLPGAAIKSF